MNDQTTAFIGGGNMSTSLIGGLIADGYDPDSLWVSDPGDDQLQKLRAGFGVHTSRDNIAVAQRADVLVLAVKPQVLGTVARELAPVVAERRPLVISIAAGTRTTALQRWLGEGAAIVRTMPNTPALVRSGATVLYATPAVSTEQRNRAESILRAVGLTLWVEEERLLDGVTALSGSGPAYFFLVMEAIQEAGVHMGLPRATAQLLTVQTAFGAAKMALESGEDVATLRRRVTSPGGTTERALGILEQGNVKALFKEALQGAQTRSEELAEILGRDPEST